MNQQEWQQALDEAFPDAVNVRFVSEDTALDVDFSSACLTVVGMQGELPVVSFADMFVDGKSWKLPLNLTEAQKEPRILYTATSPGFPVPIWFWPRPVAAAHQTDFAQQKAAIRETAMVYAGAR